MQKKFWISEFIQNSTENCHLGSFINHVGRAGGGGFPEKPCLSTWGEGGVRGLSTWTKMFMATHFAHINFGVTV